jgi:ribokinase
MVGAVGDDVFGPQMIKSMAGDGIDMTGVVTLIDQKTGVAVILVEESGENRILFTAGANFALDTRSELVKDRNYGDIAIFQLETPLDVVRPIHSNSMLEKSNDTTYRLCITSNSHTKVERALY